MKHDHGTIKATAGVLRDIITIIMALAFTHTIVQFLMPNGVTPINLSKISIGSILPFLCVLTTIIRFYHGNVSYLNTTYNTKDDEGNTRHFRTKLVNDFTILFLQSVVFCALSIYQSRLHECFMLFIVLFIADAIWCITNIWSSKRLFKESEKEQHNDHLYSQTSWFATNTLTALVMLFLLISQWNYTSNYVPLFFAIITINAAIDYWFNRRLYFPNLFIKYKSMPVAFIGARFSSAITAAGFDDNLKSLIEAAYEVMVNNGYEVRSAHRAEEYGKKLATPDELVIRDANDMIDADIFIAIWDSAISPGLLIELGWASASKTDTIILLPNNYETMINPMIGGLHMITKCHIVRYNNTAVSLQERLQDELNTIKLSDKLNSRLPMNV